MKYPTIDQYIDALRSAEIFSENLPKFTLSLGRDGEPAFSSGAFGVVFSAVSQDGKPIAIKCFTRTQWGRREAYERLRKTLPKSEYLIDIRYYTDELLVAPYGSDLLMPFDVIVMDYVEGVTLSQKVQEAVAKGDYRTLRILSERFDIMAMWLLDSTFAHGDVKPDNILVGEDLTLKLIDYDGVFVEDMMGERQRECGSQNFQHPLRGVLPFDGHIDDYSLAVISLSLRAVAADLDVYNRFCGCPSSLFVVPSEAVLGVSFALSYIEETSIVDARLIKAVKSPLPNIEGLRDILLNTFLPVELASENLDVRSVELFAFKADGKYGYADSSGKVVCEACWDEAAKFVGGFARVRQGDKWCFIDEKGEKLTRLIYDKLWDFTASEGLALVIKGAKYGYIGRDGRVKISLRYDYASPFSEGYAAVSLGGKFGFVDTTGRWKVKPQFDFARSVRSGKAEVEQGGNTLTIEIE